MDPRLRLARTAMRGLSKLSPGVAGSLAEQLWFLVPRIPLSKDARTFLHSGRSFRIHWGRRRLAAWSWGTGPKVLLVHGWGAHAAQLRALVKPLVDAGFEVVAFDAPSHGASDSGRKGRLSSSGIEYAEALDAVAKELAPVHAVIAHSIGGHVATCAVLDGLATRRVALLAPLADPAP
jgi:alpha-beta hydrolase superfamily lysophospholipase